MNATPTLQHRYETFIFDSARWSKFTPRDGDIFVCTSYKAGTTWTQMICALLIHQSPDLPTPLNAMSRWLDMRTNAIDDVVAAFDAQTHRRVIKTHTPLDGLPYYENVEYVFCGREPRDVFMSSINHFDNMNMEAFGALLEKQGQEFTPPPELPEDINDRFALWMTQGVFDWEEDGVPFWSHFRHAQTFWDFQALPNIHFLHYADLKTDLDGEMRRLAGTLNIDIPEATWPSLVKAATFDEMKSNADNTAPDADKGVWKTNKRFFNRGANEQWRGALSDESLALYDKVSRARYPADLLDWLETGSLKAGYPK